MKSPTGEEKITITGSAEHGSTIGIGGAVAVEPAEVKADLFTARFYVTVTLAKNAKNTLSFTAADRAGNVSLPTIVAIDQEDGHAIPGKLELVLTINAATMPAADPVMLAAGDTIRAVASVTDKAGHPIEAPVAISTSIPGAFVAGSDISNIRVAGDFRVAATVAGSSLSVSRSVKVAAGPAVEIALGTTPASVIAGVPVTLSAVARDAFGNPVPGTAITLASLPMLAANITPPCSTKNLAQGFTDSTHFVAYDLSGVAAGNYSFTITATAGGVSASTAIVVLPGPAARFAPVNPADCTKGEQFRFTDATWANDLPEPVSVLAGATVYYRYSVIDAYGNATKGPVSVFTTAPGAQVIDDGVSGRGQVANLSYAGTFELAAHIAGVAAPARRTFSVGVAAPHSVNLFLSNSLASKGDVVKSFATVKDRFGNVVTCPALSPVDPAVYEVIAAPAATATGGPTTCTGGIFQRDFTFSADATYAVTGTYKPGTPVAASAYVTILGFDTTPPVVTLSNIRVNGTLCVPSGSPPACAVSPGDTVDFELVANDNVSLSEVDYTAFFSSTNTLRTRRVLISANTPLPVTSPFTFNVPGGALPEAVPLVGLAVDGSGNRSSSAQLILSVSLFVPTGGRSATIVASGGLINGPNDVAFDVAGNMFIANDTGRELLEIAVGSSAPFRFSAFNKASDYLVVDAAGNVLISDGGDVWRVNATGMSVVSYIGLGGTAQGLALAGGTVAKGIVDATIAVDGSTVTVGSKVYEFDVVGNGCVAGNVCMAVGGGRNQELAIAVQANSVEANAAYNAGVNRVVLSAKSVGEAGNAFALAATVGISVSGASLSEGHGEEIFLGHTTDNNIYRFPETLTPPAVLSQNHGLFNVGRRQRGIVVKDMTTATSPNLRDLYLYLVDDGNANSLRAFRAVDATAPTQVFNITSAGVTPFVSLYDLVLEPTLPPPASNPVNGCLLASDRVAGRIYAVDTRDPAATAPTVTIVASGFNDPRGLAFRNRDLYVADRGLDAIVRLSPSPITTDCF